MIAIALGIAGVLIVLWLVTPYRPPPGVACAHGQIFTLCPHCKPTGVYPCPPSKF